MKANKISNKDPNTIQKMNQCGLEGEDVPTSYKTPAMLLTSLRRAGGHNTQKTHK